MWISMGYQQVLLTKDMLTTITGYELLNVEHKNRIGINQLGAVLKAGSWVWINAEESN